MNEFVVKRRSKKQYEQFTCRIEKELFEEIKKIVLDNDLKSINEFINDSLKYAIENMKIEE